MKVKDNTSGKRAKTSNSKITSFFTKRVVEEKPPVDQTSPVPKHDVASSSTKPKKTTESSGSSTKSASIEKDSSKESLPSKSKKMGNVPSAQRKEEARVLDIIMESTAAPAKPSSKSNKGTDDDASKLHASPRAFKKPRVLFLNLNTRCLSRLLGNKRIKNP
jgi:hypothetical protein